MRSVKRFGRFLVNMASIMGYGLAFLATVALFFGPFILVLYVIAHFVLKYW